MDIEFIASIAIITPDPPTSKKLYVDALGLTLDDADGYLHSEKIEGTNHLGVWPLEQAAQACFGADE